MHSCDNQDYFSILGVFNQWSHIPGNAETVNGSKESSQVFLYCYENMDPFFQLKSFLKLSDNEITKIGSNSFPKKPNNIWPNRYRTTFWVLLAKVHNVIEHHVPVRLKIVAKLPS